MLLSIYIINKAGGLVYQKDYSNNSTISKLSTNEYLVLAGTFHGWGDTWGWGESAGGDLLCSLVLSL